MKSGTFTNNTSFTATAAQVNVPTGTVLFQGGNFTVPSGITVLKISYGDDTQYVGVTPGSTHTLEVWTGEEAEGVYYVDVFCYNDRTYWFQTFWNDEPYLGDPDASVDISWSPEINTHTPDVTDY